MIRSISAGRYLLERHVSAALRIFMSGWSGFRASAYVLKVAIKHHLDYFLLAVLIVIAVLLLRMLLTGKPPATAELARGGRTMAVGIDIVHRTRSSERQQAARGPRPDGW